MRRASARLARCALFAGFVLLAPSEARAEEAGAAHVEAGPSTRFGDFLRAWSSRRNDRAIEILRDWAREDASETRQARALYYAGLVYADSGAYASARARADSILASHPACEIAAKARYLRGHWAYLEGRMDLAETYLLEVQDPARCPPEYHVAARFYLAAVYARTGRADQAEPIMVDLARDSSTDYGDLARRWLEKRRAQ